MINDSIVILGDEKNLLALASGTVVSHLKNQNTVNWECLLGVRAHL